MTAYGRHHARQTAAARPPSAAPNPAPGLGPTIDHSRISASSGDADYLGGSVRLACQVTPGTVPARSDRLLAKA